MVNVLKIFLAIYALNWCLTRRSAISVTICFVKNALNNGLTREKASAPFAKPT
jgi:hypothetical protein